MSDTKSKAEGKCFYAFDTHDNSVNQGDRYCYKIKKIYMFEIGKEILV